MEFLSFVMVLSRRFLDMEGWANDIAGIRKRQEALEKKLLQAQLIRRLPGLELSVSINRFALFATHRLLPRLLTEHALPCVSGLGQSVVLFKNKF